MAFDFRRGLGVRAQAVIKARIKENSAAESCGNTH